MPSQPPRPPGRGEVRENSLVQISVWPSGSMPCTTWAKRLSKSQMTGCGPPDIRRSRRCPDRWGLTRTTWARSMSSCAVQRGCASATDSGCEMISVICMVGSPQVGTSAGTCVMAGACRPPTGLACCEERWRLGRVMTCGGRGPWKAAALLGDTVAVRSNRFRLLIAESLSAPRSVDRCRGRLTCLGAPSPPVTLRFG